MTSDHRVVDYYSECMEEALSIQKAENSFYLIDNGLAITMDGCTIAVRWSRWDPINELVYVTKM